MINIRIQPDIIDPELILLGTKLIISSDINFTDIVYDGDDNNDNFYIYSLNLELTPNHIYYFKARLIYNFGYSQWTEIVGTTVGLHTSEIILNPITPTYVKPPSLDLVFDTNNHPSSHFKIQSTYDPPLGNPINSTSWLIESMSGDPIMYNRADTGNLKSIYIEDNVLDVNRVYVLKCRHILNSGDSSFFGTRLISTKIPEDFRHLIRLLKFTDTELYLTYMLPHDMTMIEWSLYINGEEVIIPSITIGNVLNLSPYINTYDGIGIVKARAKNSIDSTIYLHTPINFGLVGSSTFPLGFPLEFSGDPIPIAPLVFDSEITIGLVSKQIDYSGLVYDSTLALTDFSPSNVSIQNNDIFPLGFPLEF